MSQSVKTIEIQAKGFFELLKNRDMSMWSIFEEMINPEEEQLIIFKNEENESIAEYFLPTNKERLEEDRKLFSAYFKEKLKP